MSSPYEKIEQARALLQNQQYDEARRILLSMPDDPVALQWLQYLDSMMAQQQQMPQQQAAYGMPAQQQQMSQQQAAQPRKPRWQRKKDQSWQQAGAAPQPAYYAQQDQRSIPLVFQRQFKIVLAAALAVLSIVLIVLFFAIPLLDTSNYMSYLDRTREALGDEADNAATYEERDYAQQALDDLNESDEGVSEAEDEVKVTAWQIWRGKKGVETEELQSDWEGNFTLNLNSMINDLRDEVKRQNEDDYYDEDYDSSSEIQPDDLGGFGNVRFIDRLLVLYVLGGLVILIVAALYAFDMMRAFISLAVITGVAVILTAYAFMWPTLSTSNWRSTIDDQMLDMLNDEQLTQDTDAEDLVTTRVTWRVAKDEMLDMGETYLNKVYNTAPFKVAALLLLLGSAIPLALTWHNEKLHPELSARVQPPFAGTYQQQYPYGSEPTMIE